MNRTIIDRAQTALDKGASAAELADLYREASQRQELIAQGKAGEGAETIMDQVRAEHEAAIEGETLRRLIGALGNAEAAAKQSEARDALPGRRKSILATVDELADARARVAVIEAELQRQASDFEQTRTFHGVALDREAAERVVDAMAPADRTERQARLVRLAG